MTRLARLHYWVATGEAGARGAVQQPYRRPLGTLYTRSDVERSAELVRARGAPRPDVALMIGTGFAGLADAIEAPVRVPFSELPLFPEPGIPGHVGELVLGRLAGRQVACWRGKIQLLDGHTAQLAALPLRLSYLLGCRSLLYTNTAGAINPAYRVGEFVAITNHVNLTGANPLVGEPEGEWGTRFFDMTFPYDRELVAQLQRVAADRGVPMHEGVYLGVLGPSFETAAEIRMGAQIGADTVGMSTIMEVIAARQLKLPVVCISFVSNLAAGVAGVTVDNEDVLRTAASAFERFCQLILGMLPHMP
jgi:purine-nucleoside phosphorylase